VPRSGILSLFRSTPVHRITFDERRPDGYFTALGRQELTSGAASDTRPYDLQGRLTHSGPIPTDCRSGTCGTCWVGVLGGAERLSPVEPNEAKRLRACGYSEPSEPTPLIRLACLAKASGPISIVVPPWNGVLGRYARPV
jgi:ferredoxin